MGFRFRKSIKLLPGLRLNLSKTRVSASLGVKGATVNLGERGARGTVGLPGTGISYSEKLSGPAAGGGDHKKTRRSGGLAWVVVVLLLLAWIFFR